MKATAELYLNCLTAAIPAITKTIVENPELLVQAIQEVKTVIENPDVESAFSQYTEEIEVCAGTVQHILDMIELDDIEDTILVETP